MHMRAKNNMGILDLFPSDPLNFLGRGEYRQLTKPVVAETGHGNSYYSRRQTEEKHMYSCSRLDKYGHAC